MTSGSRPNLAGLFDGSVPPATASSVAGKLGPTLVAVPDDAGGPADPHPETITRAPDPVPVAAPRKPGLAGPPRLGWFDPVRVVELYFGWLQTVLDANRNLAVGVAAAVKTLPGRITRR